MRLRTAYLLAAAATCLLAAAAIAVAAKPPAGPKSVVLGKTATYPPPGCPTPANCEVIARVTGIQMMADGTPHPFRAPKTGTLVSWWLKLPKLSDTQMQSFNSFFGGDPTARISVLRRGLRGKFRLLRQSPTQSLAADLGKKGRVKYKLQQPLRVQAGDYIGLTAVTWVPSFAVNLDGLKNYWLASRPRTRCDTPSSKDPKKFAAYYKRNQAHLESSTALPYQCTYRTARLLYWARIVPDPVTPGPATTPGAERRATRLAGAGVVLAELLEAVRRTSLRRRDVVLRSVVLQRLGAAARRRRGRRLGLGGRGGGRVGGGGHLVGRAAVRLDRAGGRLQLRHARRRRARIAAARDHHAEQQSRGDGGNCDKCEAGHGSRLAVASALAQSGQAAEAVRAVAEVATDELLAVRADAEILRRPGEARGAVGVGDEPRDHVHPLAGDLVVVAHVLTRRLHPVHRDHGFTPRGGRAQAISLRPSHTARKDSKAPGKRRSPFYPRLRAAADFPRLPASRDGVERLQRGARRSARAAWTRDPSPLPGAQAGGARLRRLVRHLGARQARGGADPPARQPGSLHGLPAGHQGPAARVRVRHLRRLRGQGIQRPHRRRARPLHRCERVGRPRRGRPLRA